MRKDSDLLGEVLIPDDTYYGAQTARALQLFEQSDHTIDKYPSFVYCMGAVKKACAIVNHRLGLLSDGFADAIVRACEEVMEGKLNRHLVLDMLGGNDLAPVHMNFNEVIACRANEILTGSRSFLPIQPNSHVNLGTSTCDTAYIATKFAFYLECGRVIQSVEALQAAYEDKAAQFAGMVKIAHTCFQDASPISFGQFYGAAASFLKRQIQLLKEIREEALEHTIGSTVIGTGLGSFHGFHQLINEELERILHVACPHAEDPFDSLQYADFFLRASALLKSTITGASKMARDIRVMSSGPRAGLSEISIAPVQNGSSYFPGKVNPSLPELVNIACYQVCGCDASITMAVEAGELDVTPWYPVFSVNLFEECSLIYRSLEAFAEKCVRTIQVNAESNYAKASRSLGLATVASSIFGYKNATKAAMYAAEQDISVADAVVKLGMMEEADAKRIFDPLTLTDAEASSRLLSSFFSKEDRY